jgi:stage II sporulation protein D
MKRALPFIRPLVLGLALLPVWPAGVSEGVGHSGDRIKVLIMDEGFEREPAPGEQMTLLRRAEGELLVGRTSYLGDIEVWRGERGLYLINELPLETYVAGVVTAEAGENWTPDALKALAVAVRTYTLFRRAEADGRKYDVTSTVLHQVYRGLSADPLVVQAVEETRGRILTYMGEPIAAYYHSTCGGVTEAAEEVFGVAYPYLQPVESVCTLSPLSLWERRIPLREIESATQTKGIVGIEVAARARSGRASKVTIRGNPSVTALDAAVFRRKLGWRRLPSTNFTVRMENGDAVFEGKGYGHGVGLCQWSSEEMARGGTDWRDILAHFYPGTDLTTIHEGQ